MVKATATSMNQRLTDVNRKFKASCQQVRIIDRKMDVRRRRYCKAKDEKLMAAFNSVRLQLATLEGVRQAFYMYASDKATERRCIVDEIRDDCGRTSNY